MQQEVLDSIFGKEDDEDEEEEEEEEEPVDEKTVLMESDASQDESIKEVE